MTMEKILTGLVGLIIGIIGCVLGLIAVVLCVPAWVLAMCGGKLLTKASELLDFDECEPVEENSEEVPT